MLGPAIPEVWGGCSVKGLRVREGGVVDFQWDDNELIISASLTGRKSPLLIINKWGKVLVDI